MSLRRVFFSAVVIFSLGSLPGWTQVVRQPASTSIQRTYFVRGSLRNNDDNRPLEMIRVELRTITGQTLGTAFSRSNGEFEFYGIPNGVYYVVVEEKGYEPIRESVEIYNVGRAGLFLFLKRASDVFSAPGKTISVREMQIPGKARDALQKGIERLHEKRDYKGSLDFFQRAVAQYPSYYEAYYEMGLAYLRLDQIAESEQALRKSIELSQGRYADAYFLLASVLSNKQEFAEAQTLARQGLELNGNAWQGYFEMARALFGQNQFETAEKNALEARTRKPDFPLIHLLLANLHLRKRDYPSLLEDLDTYLKLEPNGTMSEQARRTREQVQRALTNASAPAAPPPKP